MEAQSFPTVLGDAEDARSCMAFGSVVKSIMLTWPSFGAAPARPTRRGFRKTRARRAPRAFARQQQRGRVGVRGGERARQDVHREAPPRRPPLATRGRQRLTGATGEVGLEMYASRSAERGCVDRKLLSNSGSSARRVMARPAATESSCGAAADDNASNRLQAAGSGDGSIVRVSGFRGVMDLIVIEETGALAVGERSTASSLRALMVQFARFVGDDVPVSLPRPARGGGRLMR